MYLYSYILETKETRNRKENATGKQDGYPYVWIWVWMTESSVWGWRLETDEKWKWMRSGNGFTRSLLRFGCTSLWITNDGSFWLLVREMDGQIVWTLNGILSNTSEIWNGKINWIQRRDSMKVHLIELDELSKRTG